MVLNEITYMPVMGKPLIMYLGIITLAFLLAAALIAVLNKYGIYRIHPKWHPLVAQAAILLAIIHGFLGVAAYF